MLNILKRNDRQGLSDHMREFKKLELRDCDYTSIPHACEVVMEEADRVMHDEYYHAADYFCSVENHPLLREWYGVVHANFEWVSKRRLKRVLAKLKREPAFLEFQKTFIAEKKALFKEARDTRITVLNHPVDPNNPFQISYFYPEKWWDPVAVMREGYEEMREHIMQSVGLQIRQLPM